MDNFTIFFFNFQTIHFTGIENIFLEQLVVSLVAGGYWLDVELFFGGGSHGAAHLLLEVVDFGLKSVVFLGLVLHCEVDRAARTLPTNSRTNKLFSKCVQ